MKFLPAAFSFLVLTAAQYSYAQSESPSEVHVTSNIDHVRLKDQWGWSESEFDKILAYSKEILLEYVESYFEIWNFQIHDEDEVKIYLEIKSLLDTDIRLDLKSSIDTPNQKIASEALFLPYQNEFFLKIRKSQVENQIKRIFYEKLMPNSHSQLENQLRRNVKLNTIAYWHKDEGGVPKIRLEFQQGMFDAVASDAIFRITSRDEEDLKVFLFATADDKRGQDIDFKGGKLESLVLVPTELQRDQERSKFIAGSDSGIENTELLEVHLWPDNGNSLHPTNNELFNYRNEVQTIRKEDLDAVSQDGLESTR